MAHELFSHDLLLDDLKVNMLFYVFLLLVWTKKVKMCLFLMLGIVSGIYPDPVLNIQIRYYISGSGAVHEILDLDPQNCSQSVTFSFGNFFQISFFSKKLTKEWKSIVEDPIKPVFFHMDLNICLTKLELAGFTRRGLNSNVLGSSFHSVGIKRQ
jgi:hypothetical protein